MEIREFQMQTYRLLSGPASQRWPVPKVPAHSRATKVGNHLENCSEIHSWPPCLTFCIGLRSALARGADKAPRGGSHAPHD